MNSIRSFFERIRTHANIHVLHGIFFGNCYAMWVYPHLNCLRLFAAMITTLFMMPTIGFLYGVRYGRAMENKEISVANERVYDILGSAAVERNMRVGDLILN